MSLISVAERGLLRDGQPHQIVSGSIHYFRVHPDQWADRLDRLAAMGANTLDTYVAWNVHERRRGEASFEGWRDLPRFVRLAGERGLDVILRPGPYICAEWDNGGLPSWLTGQTGIGLRTSDAAYTDAVEAWFARLMPQLVPLQAAYGGPIVAWQVENEYGSFADDAAFLEFTRDALVRHGAVELLYTADGPTDLMLDGGTMPGVFATATFGSRPQESFAVLQERRRATPLMCAEYWNGWFDHWGEKHHVREPESVAADVDAILAANGSVSIYMAHGGSNFGLGAGSNFDGVLQPTITSYDSDAPIAEDGSLTPKWHALRQVIGRRLARPLPQPPADPELLSPATFDPRIHGRFAWPARQDAAAGAPTASVAPLSFEELGLPSGLVRYVSTPVLPRGESQLVLEGIRDLATVLVDGEALGTLDAESGLTGLTMTGDGQRHRLEILVEAYGHINYGQLLGERKGLLGLVRIDRRRVTGWTSQGLDLERITPGQLLRWCAGEDIASVAPAPNAPAKGRAAVGGVLASATVEVASPLDAHLSLPGWGRGYVWVNDTLLGRYDRVGPQRSYYVPAPLLTAGSNTVTLLEMSHTGDAPAWLAGPQLGETEQFVEVFD